MNARAAVALAGLLSMASAAQAQSTGVPAIPSDQAAFIAAVANGQSAYASGETDFQRGAARPARAAAICKMISRSSVSDWVGTVSTLTTNGEGKGVLGVTIADDIVVTTWNNAFSDTTTNTLIRAGSAVFTAMGSLKKGDAVRFSGSFVKDKTDCFQEQSLTMRGSMTDPAFTFRFKSIERL